MRRHRAIMLKSAIVQGKVSPSVTLFLLFLLNPRAAGGFVAPTLSLSRYLSNAKTSFYKGLAPNFTPTSTIYPAMYVCIPFRASTPSRCGDTARKKMGQKYAPQRLAGWRRGAAAAGLRWRVRQKYTQITP